MDEYTDVITFNLEDNGDSIEGEIYISWDRVKDNAVQLQQRIDKELKRIVIHGCLHLVGYDDQTETDKNEMTLLENQYLNKASNSLIDIAFMSLVILFIVLLLLSAFFSGTETAYFNIKTHRESVSENIRKLLKNPRKLLVTLLTGNTIVNIVHGFTGCNFNSRVCRETELV